MGQVALKIDGMHCGHCVTKVSKALEAVPGVAVQSVEIGSATVVYDPARAGLEAIADAVHNAGYEAHAA
jgi:copper chaperone